MLELILIIANIGTAVVPYSIHKRVNEAGALGFVTARVMECMFIAVGLVFMLAISTLRQDRRVVRTPPWARDSEPSTSGASGSDRVSSSASGTA